MRALVLLLLCYSVILHISTGQVPDISKDSLTSLAAHYNERSRNVGYANLDSALYFAEQAFSYAQASESIQQIALAQFNKAFVYHVQGDFEAALSLYDSTLQYEKLGMDSVLLSRTWNNLGALHNVMDNYPKALENYQKSLSYKLLLGNEAGAATTYNNLGIIKYNQERYGEALAYYQEAISITDTGDVRGLSRAYGNVGLVYIHKALYDSALKYCNLAYQMLGSGEHDCLRMYPANDLADVHQRLGNLALAEKFAKESFQAGRDCSDPPTITGALLALAKINRDKGRWQLAEQQLLEAYEISEEHRFVSGLNMISEDLYQLYKAQGQTASALKYKEKQSAFRDSLFNSDLTSKLTRLEMEYDFSREKDSLSFQFEREKATLDAQLAKKSLLQQVGAIILLLALLSTFLFARSYHLKKRSNELLAEKNALVSRSLSEKELLMGEVHHRIKNNLQIVSSLLNIQEKLIIDPSFQTVIKDTKTRVISMALVHENLQVGEKPTSVSAKDYLEDLLEAIRDTFHHQTKPIRFNLEIGAGEIPSDMAVHLGLIINEGLTNAIKYAFPEGVVAFPEISVKLTATAYGLNLLVQDNGVGMELSATESYGINLIRTLVDTMQGKVAFTQENGTLINVEIPLSHES